MDVDSTYSTDVTIGENDSKSTIRQMISNVTHKKGRGINENRYRGNIKYDTMESSANRSSGPAKSIQGWVLIVTNIHPEATEEDISNIFGDFGKLKSLHLNVDRRTGYVKGYALIEYDTRKEAEKAVNASGNLSLHGLTLGVNWAFFDGPIVNNK